MRFELDSSNTDHSLMNPLTFAHTYVDSMTCSIFHHATLSLIIYLSIVSGWVRREMMADLMEWLDRKHIKGNRGKSQRNFKSDIICDSQLQLPFGSPKPRGSQKFRALDFEDFIACSRTSETLEFLKFLSKNFFGDHLSNFVKRILPNTSFPSFFKYRRSCSNPYLQIVN